MPLDVTTIFAVYDCGVSQAARWPKIWNKFYFHWKECTCTNPPKSSQPEYLLQGCSEALRSPLKPSTCTSQQVDVQDPPLNKGVALSSKR